MPGDQKNNVKIAIIYPESTLDSIPCVISFIQLLAQSKISIDIYTRSRQGDHYTNLGFQETNIKVFALTENYLKNDLPVSIQKFYPLIRVFDFWRFWLKTVKSRNYDFYIGVDQKGIIFTYLITLFTSIPILYFCLEIFFADELEKMASNKIYKFVELKASRKAFATIIQDQERANLLAKENQINPNEIYFFPNSPVGEASYNKQYFLHNHFSINKDKKILLHAGTIADWAYCRELTKIASELDSQYLIFFQSRYDSRDDPYCHELIDLANPEKTHFSLKPFAYSQLNHVYRSADIGLAFYNTEIIGKNCVELGLSSGKFAFFLYNGLPVIVNQETSLKDFVLKYKCGWIIKDFDELNYACNKILENYYFYSENACRCFNENFNVKHYQKIIIESIFNEKQQDKIQKL